MVRLGGSRLKRADVNLRRLVKTQDWKGKGGMDCISGRDLFQEDDQHDRLYITPLLRAEHPAKQSLHFSYFSEELHEVDTVVVFILQQDR